MILPACADLCSKVLVESATKKIAQIPLSARTVARRNQDMAADIETQLLERLVKSPWFAIQCDESTDIESKAVLLVFFDIFMKKMFMKTCYVFCISQKPPQPPNYLRL